MKERRTHPLKAWRLTQTRISHASKAPVTLGISQAAQAVGVPYQTWRSWELFPDEGGFIPDRVNMIKVYRYTRGQVRPDHFYDLPDLRAEADEAQASGGDSPIEPASTPAGSPGPGGSVSAARSFPEPCPI